MAVVERNSLIERIRGYMGESPNDDGISILEDISDSWTDAVGVTEEEVARRVSEVENSWRKKYADRFMGREDIPLPDGGEVSSVVEVEEDTDKLPTTYEELYKIERGEE